MSRKHFKAFADIALGHVKAHNVAAARAIYYAVVSVNDNPLFKRDRFMTACGLTDDMLAGRN